MLSSVYARLEVAQNILNRVLPTARLFFLGEGVNYFFLLYRHRFSHNTLDNNFRAISKKRVRLHFVSVFRHVNLVLIYIF